MNVPNTISVGQIEVNVSDDLLRDYVETVEKISNFFRTLDPATAFVFHLEESHIPGCLDVTFDLHVLGIEVEILAETMQVRWRSKDRKDSHILTSTSLIRMGQFYIHEWHHAAFHYCGLKEIFELMRFDFQVIEVPGSMVRIYFPNKAQADTVVKLYNTGFLGGY